MRTDFIEGFELSPTGNLYVFPMGNYDKIFRAARSVRWEKEHRYLYVLEPHTLSLEQCFDLIVRAVKEEYLTMLEFASGTVWPKNCEDFRHKLNSRPSYIS